MEDNDIISLFFERSETAITETKKKYGKFVFGLAMQILHSESDSEECENDTYMAAWSAISPQRPYSFRAFLLKIARNLALKKYRFLNAEKRSPKAAIPLEELGECASETGEDIRYCDNELSVIINDFLGTLNEGNRRVFMFRYWYFVPINEISERYGISRSKVETILFRTRKKLKKYLEDRGVL